MRTVKKATSRTLNNDGRPAGHSTMMVPAGCMSSSLMQLDLAELVGSAEQLDEQQLDEQQLDLAEADQQAA